MVYDDSSSIELVRWKKLDRVFFKEFSRLRLAPDDSVAAELDVDEDS